MKKKEKIKKYTKIFETLLFITVVINILLFAYKKENILSRANYKILVQESEGSSNYVAYSGSKFPKSGYTFASYECENGGTITETSKATFSYSGDADSCVLKFDISEQTNDDTLYNVLKNEYNDGGNVALYPGEHADAYDKSGEEEIYAFTISSTNQDVLLEQLEKINVIFAGFCWQMIRTTDTGGVKMIYNGVPSNGTCNNTGENQIIGTSKFNENNNSIAYVGFMYNTIYELNSMIVVTPTLGNSFTYSNGTYTLVDTVTASRDTLYDEVPNHHYYCKGNTQPCENLYYATSGGISNSKINYIELENGSTGIDEAISKMLFNENVNHFDSTIKVYLENWFENNLLNYESYLEDTVFCNDRRINDLGAYNPNGGMNDLEFKNNNVDYDLSCANTDRFSTFNEKAKLKYPVGLATNSEYAPNYLYNNAGLEENESIVDTWLISPSSVYDKAKVFASPWLGYSVDNEKGVRPVISLKPGTEYVDGDGSRNNPYIVGTKKSYTTLNKLQSLNSNIQVNSGTPDFSQIAETDEGLYSAEDDYGTSYYWRGAATTNYIKFGKNSSNQDLYWRIVRINGNGSLRLFYLGDDINDNDYISDVVFNNSDTSNAYLGYMYGDPNGSTFESTHANINSSSAKNALDNWYVSNIQGKTIEEYISDTEFCYDRSIIEENTGNGVGTNVTHYASYTRNYTNKSPSLLCTQKNDRFTVNDVGVGNGNLSKPIGLITLDEILMAGGNYEINEEHFLNGNIYYWTGTPIRFEYSEANVAFLTNEGDFDWVEVNAKKDLVPVINITPEAVSTLTGSGTVADPFVVH